MTTPARIPLPLPSDSAEISEALDVAASLWRGGNRSDAIRWVRRAAQAADEAGDALRMAALASASADLEGSVAPAPPARSSVPPPLPSRSGSAVPPRPASVSPPPASVSRMKSKTTPPPLPDRRSRVRVSIKTSVLDPTRVVVRRLEDGMALPPGTHEGWLETVGADVWNDHSGVVPTSVEPAKANGKSVR